MNQEVWDSLTSKIAHRDQLQAEQEQRQDALEQLRVEIDELATSLQADLAALRGTPEVQPEA